MAGYSVRVFVASFLEIPPFSVGVIEGVCMKKGFMFHRTYLQRLFLIPSINADKLWLVEKRTIVRWLLYMGMLIAFYGTLNPWFCWPIARYVHYLAAIPIALGMLISRNLKHGLFTRNDYFVPLFFCALLQWCMAILSGKNINGFIVVAFSLCVYLSLFRLERQELFRLSDMLTTSLAAILAVSIPFYLLFKAGFPLPHSHIVPEAWDYSFENYRFFLVDDRFAFTLLPRFHSVFLEPSHLGMACIALLYSQIGKWKTWRCRILFLGLIMTFSLAAYICLVVMTFSSAWMKGKAIVGKLLLLVVVVTGVVVGSIFYNKGQNMVNLLIVERLQLNDKGNFEGDNRTSEEFTKEYDKFASSAAILTGKGQQAMDRFSDSTGNAGYRVFLYTYGLISLFFLLFFFASIFYTSECLRPKMAMTAISFLSFIAHGQPIKYYFFIPLYILLFVDVYPADKKNRLGLSKCQEKDSRLSES